MTATCTTPDCPEFDIVKSQNITLFPGERVLCGGCGHPCELRDDAGQVVVS